MIITYLRSSSYNTWDFCPHKYTIDYTLGWRSPANKKAEKGTVTHKALELLARVKLAKQKGERSFQDDELGKFDTKDITVDIAAQIAYHHISEKTKDMYVWDEDDFKDCKKWVYDTLKMNDGIFNPANQNIVEPERYFDITIDESWGAYNYKLPNGETLKGQFAIKGTLDLITKLDKKTYELVDYKTGKRMDWNTGKEKTYEKLRDDPQLRMYHYAASKLYPDIHQIIVTIVWITDGGPISMCFDDNDLKKTELMLKRRFQVIQNTFKPKRIFPNWKCTKLCHFGKHDLQGNPITKEEYKEKSICAQIGNDILTLGMDRVMLKHSKADVSAYGSGGGRSA